MNKKIILTVSVAVGVLLSGCGLGVEVSGKEMEASAGTFGNHSSYFDQYHSEKSANTCKVSGTIHQGDDRNGILAYLETEAENGSVTVVGSMNCAEDDIRLVYLSPDGTETLIASGTDLKINRQISVTKGEGSICFAGDGQSAICEFAIRLEVGEGVTIADSKEKMEEIEEIEEIEDIEKPEEPEIPEISEISEKSDGIKEVENSWPEHICYQADGLYGNPVSTIMEIEHPVTLSLVCETLDGKLKLKIVDQDCQKICADLDNPDGAYTVEIEKAGTYQVLFYAKEHVGSVKITPVEE